MPDLFLVVDVRGWENGHVWPKAWKEEGVNASGFWMQRGSAVVHRPIFRHSQTKSTGPPVILATERNDALPV